MRGARSSPSNLRARLWAQGRGTYGARRARTPPPRGEAGTPENPWAQCTVPPRAAKSYDPDRAIQGFEGARPNRRSVLVPPVAP